MFRFCVRVAPGCHSGPGLGPVVSRHTRYDLAVRNAAQSDRWAVYTIDGDSVIYQIAAQGSHSGPGRYGRGLASGREG